MRSMTGSITVTRAPLRFIAVAAAHVGLFYVVTDALRFESKPEVDRETEVRFLPEKPDPIVEEEPLEPTFVKTWTHVPDPLPPQPRYEEEVEPRPDPVPLHVAPHEPGGSTSFRGLAEFVPVRANPDHPLTRAAYPAASIRLEEEGVVELSIYVLRTGRIADVKVREAVVIHASTAQPWRKHAGSGSCSPRRVGAKRSTRGAASAWSSASTAAEAALDSPANNRRQGNRCSVLERSRWRALRSRAWPTPPNPILRPTRPLPIRRL